jgi:methyltransferase (TIGR00027 family)
MEASPSRTAMLAALLRGQHRLEDTPPWVLDDPFALVLLGPLWRQLADMATSLAPKEELRREVRAAVVVRGRYAEERLTDGRCTQYVILGAGLDSFAWRRPDLLRSTRLFEVDHPASQAWKRQRIEELALPESDRHVFVPIDFEVESLREGLDAAGFDWGQPTLFSWVGVVPYLTTEAVVTTLRTIASCASGSAVVLTYRADDSILDDNGRTLLEIISALAAGMGEPFQDGWPAAAMQRLVEDCGLQVEDHPTRDELVQRYLADRTDGLVPWITETYLSARVA